MAHLTAAEKQALVDRIREIESQTSGELVTVIAQSSDNYLYIPTLWAALLALLLPGLVSLLALPLQSEWVYLLQVGLFVLLAVTFRWQPLRRRIVPRTIQHQRASRHAHELFFIEGLHLTAERTGVMIFVSIEERYVEIIADRGISDKVDAAVWRDIVETFVQDVRRDEIAQGYMTAIDSCGVLLQEQFPGQADDRNELPDHLIEV